MKSILFLVLLFSLANLRAHAQKTESSSAHTVFCATVGACVAQMPNDTQIAVIESIERETRVEFPQFAALPVHFDLASHSIEIEETKATSALNRRHLVFVGASIALNSPFGLNAIYHYRPQGTITRAHAELGGTFVGNMNTIQLSGAYHPLRKGHLFVEGAFMDFRYPFYTNEPNIHQPAAALGLGVTGKVGHPRVIYQVALDGIKFFTSYDGWMAPLPNTLNLRFTIAVLPYGWKR
jgi:hypothetical protein